MIILKLLHVQGMEKIGNFLFLINASSTDSKICQSFARVETNYSIISRVFYIFPASVLAKLSCGNQLMDRYRRDNILPSSKVSEFRVISLPISSPVALRYNGSSSYPQIENGVLQYFPFYLNPSPKKKEIPRITKYIIHRIRGSKIKLNKITLKKNY